MDMVLNEQEVMLRKIRVFLKGRVVGFSVKAGKKYHSIRQTSDDFEAGKLSVDDSPEDRFLLKQTVTACHILYNLTRHNRGHLGSQIEDAKFLSKGIYVRRHMKILEKKYGEKSSEFFRNSEMTKDMV